MNSEPSREAMRVKDPVCGMMVDPASARGGSYTYQATTYYFCNPKCNERFQAEPEKFLEPNYKPGMHAMVQLGTRPVTIGEVTSVAKAPGIPESHDGAPLRPVESHPSGAWVGHPSHFCLACYTRVPEFASP